MNHEDRPETISHNARWGLILFALYVVLYAGFIVRATVNPLAMGQATWFGSVNEAIVLGMGLIVAAFVLAGVYMMACGGQGKSGDEGKK